MQHIDKQATQRAKLIARYTKGSILDVGCNTMILKQFININQRYIGIDINGHPNIIADAQHLPFKSNSFDSIVMSEVIEHVNNPVKAIKECARVSRDYVIITTPNPFRLDSLLEWIFRKNDIASKYHLFRFGENEMKNIIRRYMKVSKCFHTFLRIPTFTRFELLSLNINSRFGSTSIYICTKLDQKCPKEEKNDYSNTK